MLDNNQPHESRPEMGGVTYRPGLYKIPMVRMCGSTDENRECTGLKVGHIEMYVALIRRQCGLVKIVCMNDHDVLKAHPS